MFFLLGLLGFFQATFLPGMLATAYWVRPARWSAFWPICFGLSLCFNYALVLILTSCGLYTRTSMLLVCGLEGLLFTGLLAARKLSFPHWDGPGLHRRLLEEFALRPLFFLGRMLFWGLLLFSLYKMIRLVGGVFTNWDAVVSWNQWAISWALNEFPHGTYNYPQLLPISESISYVLMDSTEIQFFSYAVGLLYLPLSISFLYSLYDQGRYGAGLLLTALGVFIWFLKYTPQIGCADFPVLSLGLFSLCAFLHWRDAASQADAAAALALALIFAAGAAVMKQAGLVWLAILPFAFMECKSSPGRNLPAGTFVKWTVGLICLFVLPWYAYVRYHIWQGDMSSEISWVTQGIHQGRGYFERILLAARGTPEIFIMAAAAFAGLFVRGLRAISFMGLLYTLIWAAFFSYSSRNAALGIPFLLFSAGSSCEQLFFSPLKRIWGACAFSLKRFAVGMAIFCMAIVFACAYFSPQINAYLTMRQEKKLFDIGEPAVNQALLAAMKRRALPVVTNYQLISYLPGVDKDIVSFVSFENISEKTRRDFVKKLRQLHVCYVLISTAFVNYYLLNLPQATLTLAASAGSYNLYIAEAK